MPPPRPPPIMPPAQAALVYTAARWYHAHLNKQVSVIVISDDPVVTVQ